MQEEEEVIEVEETEEESRFIEETLEYREIQFESTIMRGRIKVKTIHSCQAGTCNQQTASHIPVLQKRYHSLRT